MNFRSKIARYIISMSILFVYFCVLLYYRDAHFVLLDSQI